MSSIVPGFAYDIFISYRQKDNKGDRWVSKFIEALRTELEATFKEDVSVYFDENPHDRLQETDNVDKSLEGKLKCLIFIPILSQTYCDAASYAWQHEFLAFVSMAEGDRFGRYVKLKRGNVTSRILPIRIHDLEPEDIKMFEKGTGSLIRTLDFVFKTSSGVNRPLRVTEDHPNDNINKTFYRDQINKVAYAIKEIILSLKAEAVLSEKSKTHPYEPEKDIEIDDKIKELDNPVTISRIKMIFRFATFSLLVLIILLFIFKGVFDRKKTKVIRDPDGRISIAVNNFDNSTNDTSLNWLKMGIPELLRNSLTESEELLVQNTQAMNELYESIGHIKNAAVVTSLSRETAIKLKAGTYITGSFQKYGNNILILAKLIDTKSDELLWTDKKEGSLEKIKSLADSLSTELKNFLEIKVLKHKVTAEFGDINTKSPQALKQYIEGMELMIKGKMQQASHSFEESYKVDTTFTLAALYASYSCSYSYDFVAAQKWTRIAYKYRNSLTYNYRLWAELFEAANITRNCDSILYYNNLLAQSDIKSRLFWYDIGYNYSALEQYENAVKAFDKVESISSEWGGDWVFVDYYRNFGYACHKAGLFDKEANITEKGLQLFPDNGPLLFGLALWALTSGDTAKTREYIDKRIIIAKKEKWSSSKIAWLLADLYYQENMFDKAEEYCRHSFQLDPRNNYNISFMAYILIMTDRNVDEGISLINSSQATYSENPFDFRSKGIGYYKQGRYREALDILKKFEGYEEGFVWDPVSFKFLKMTKEALARQK